jgi:uncharacterized protein (DUF1330 family)
VHVPDAADATERKLEMKIMRSRYVIAFTIIASGAAGMLATALQAQDKPAPALYVSEFTVTNPEGLQPYRDAVDATFKPYGGYYVVRGGAVTPLEDETKTRIVVIGFDSVEKAKAWYNSPEYQELKPIRVRNTNSRTYIVEAMPKQS